jgi:predicted metal-dependent hydrolase
MDEMPPEFWQGINQFNQQQFYACHDTLEALWIEAVEPEKTFYQGVLQIAVALYHLGNQNFRGAIILLGEGMNRLRHYQPVFASINVAKLLTQSRKLQADLQQFGLPSASGEQRPPNLNQTNLDGAFELFQIERASNTNQ